MSARVNLDFFVPPPKRHDCVQDRLARQRACMYEWRHDYAASTFDAATGERRVMRPPYQPAARQHPAPAGHTRLPTLAGDGGAAATATTGTITANTTHMGTRTSSSGLYTVAPAAAAAAGAQRRPATAGSFGSGEGAIWVAAACCAGDRRRLWKQTGFTFDEDYFNSSRADASHTRLDGTANSAAALAAECRARRGVTGGLYTPYLHDTILLCEPLAHPMELRRSFRGGRELAGHRLPPVRQASASTSPMPGTILAVTCNGPEAKVRELQAAADATRAALLKHSALSMDLEEAGRTTPHEHSQEHNVQTESPPAPSSAVQGGRVQRRSDVSETMDAATATLSSSAGGTHEGVGDTAAASAASAAAPSPAAADAAAGLPTATTTWCDAVGPSVAAKQRAIAMAEGVYADLLVSRAQARANALAAAAMASQLPKAPPPSTRASADVPEIATCELAYTLRPAYVEARRRRSTTTATLASTAVRRSTSSQLACRNALTADGYSASADDAASGTTQRTTPTTSPTAVRSTAQRRRPGDRHAVAGGAGGGGGVGEVGADRGGGNSDSRKVEHSGPTRPPSQSPLSSRSPVVGPITASLLVPDIVTTDPVATATVELQNGGGGTGGPDAAPLVPPALSLAELDHPPQQRGGEGGATGSGGRLVAPYTSDLSPSPSASAVPQLLHGSQLSTNTTQITSDSPYQLHSTQRQATNATSSGAAAAAVAAAAGVVEVGSVIVLGEGGGGSSGYFSNDAPHSTRGTGHRHSVRTQPRRSSASTRVPSQHTSGRDKSTLHHSSDQPYSYSQGEDSRDSAQQQHHHHRSTDTFSPAAHRRMPTESKETRVYAVRVRRDFANADAAMQQRCATAPLRRGVPVMLPEEWL